MDVRGSDEPCGACNVSSYASLPKKCANCSHEYLKPHSRTCPECGSKSGAIVFQTNRFWKGYEAGKIYYRGVEPNGRNMRWDGIYWRCVEHDRISGKCKDCGVGYCKHKRRSYRCKLCAEEEGQRRETEEAVSEKRREEQHSRDIIRQKERVKLAELAGFTFEEWGADEQLVFIRSKIEGKGTSEQVDVLIGLISEMSVRERYDFFEKCIHDYDSVNLPAILHNENPNEKLGIVVSAYWANRIRKWELPFRTTEEVVRDFLNSEKLPEWVDGPRSCYSVFCYDGQNYWEPTLEIVRRLNSIFHEYKSRISQSIFFGGQDEWNEGFDAIVPPGWNLDITIFGERGNSVSIDDLIQLAGDAGYVLTNPSLVGYWDEYIHG